MREIIHELQVHQAELELQNQELREVRDALEESRERYADLYDFAPVGYVTLSPEGLILAANLTASRELGLERQRLTGKSFWSHVAREDRTILHHHLLNAFRSGRRVSAEVRLERNPEIWVRMESISAEDQNGKSVCRTSLIDITEQKRATAALQKAHDDLELRVRERTAELSESNRLLETSNRNLDDFAHVISHDLREPLRKIRMFGKMVGRPSAATLDEKSLDYVRRMQNAAERMEVLLDSILDYSRVSTRTVPFEEIDVAEALRNAVSNLEVSVLDSEAVIDIEDVSAHLEANPVQIMQLFQNLLANALKFRREGIAPRVKVSSRFFDGGGPGSGDYEITVEDNGIGFDEKYADTIFMPFLRLHGRSDAYEGSGMGLAICKKIVERHGGTSTARSRPGEGATFIVRLPERQTDERVHG